MKTKKERIFYYDVLRAFAIIAIIIVTKPLFWSFNHTHTNYRPDDISRHRRHWCAYFSNDQRSASFKQRLSESV